MDFKKYLEKNLSVFQQAVEEELEIILGEIEIVTSSKYSSNILANTDTDHPKKIFCNLNYVRSYLQSIYSKRSLMESSLHELFHLSEYKILGERIAKLPDKGYPDWVEGFAEYMSRKTMNKYFKTKPTPIILDSYRKEYFWFKKEVKKNNLQIPDDFKNYLINNCP